MQQKQRKKLQQKWINLYSSCSFDGIFETKGITRIFWLLVVCAATVLAIALFLGNIVEFLDYSTSTSLEEVFHNKRVKFPTVTICNLNTVSRRKVQKNLFGLKESDIVTFYQNMHDGDMESNNETLQKVIDTFRRNNITGLGEIIKLYEYTIDEMLQDPHCWRLHQNHASSLTVNAPMMSFTK